MSQDKYLYIYLKRQSLCFIDGGVPADRDRLHMVPKRPLGLLNKQTSQEAPRARMAAGGWGLAVMETRDLRHWSQLASK